MDSDPNIQSVKVVGAERVPCYSHSNIYTHPHNYPHEYTHPDYYAYPHLHSHPHIYPHSDRYADPDCHADEHALSYPIAHPRLRPRRYGASAGTPIRVLPPLALLPQRPLCRA